VVNDVATGEAGSFLVSRYFYDSPTISTVKRRLRQLDHPASPC
jgi:hypothetical protein